METAAIVIIFTLFMLIKREDLRNRAIRLAGRGQLNVMTQALDDAGRRLSRYLLLQCVINTGYGVVFGLALYLIGVPHALLWGVFAGVLRFVPMSGCWSGRLFQSPWRWPFSPAGTMQRWHSECSWFWS